MFMLGEHVNIFSEDFVLRVALPRSVSFVLDPLSYQQPRLCACISSTCERIDVPCRSRIECAQQAVGCEIDDRKSIGGFQPAYALGP